jgi:hypothetical protein
MVSSTNLTTWTGLGSTIFSKEMNSIAYNGTDTYVAVGRGTNTVAYRYGGVWTGLGSTFFTAGYSAQWQNNKFYITGKDGYMYSSSDGISWSPFNVPFLKGAYDIAYGNETWVAVGEGINGIAYSYDAISWYGLGTTIFTVGKGIIYNLNRFIATGQGNHSLAYSLDGITWYGRGTTTFSSYGNNVGSNNLLTVIGSANTTAIGYRAGYQYQGTNSVSIGFSSGVYNQKDNSVAIGSYAGYSNQSNASVAVGYKAGYANQGSGSVQIGYEAGYLGVSDIKKFVAVGSSTNTLSTSTDGLSWTGLGTSIFSTQGNAVASNNKIWIAVGSGTNTVAKSSDNGVSWSGYGTTLFSTAGNAVIYGNNLWVITGTGTNTLMTSADDGETWTARSHTLANINGLFYANGVYLAGGNSSGSTSQISYSTNGTTWTELVAYASGVSSSKLSGLYNNNYSYVLGNTKINYNDGFINIFSYKYPSGNATVGTIILEQYVYTFSYAGFVSQIVMGFENDAGGLSQRNFARFIVEVHNSSNQKVFDAINEKKLNSGVALGTDNFYGFSDSNLTLFNNMQNKLWVRTQNTKLDHIGWELYLDNDNEYVKYKDQMLKEQKIRVNIDLSNKILLLVN